jgi:hypothetical protein
VAEVYDGTKNQLRVEIVPATGSVLEFVGTTEAATAVIVDGFVRLTRVD